MPLRATYFLSVIYGDPVHGKIYVIGGGSDHLLPDLNVVECYDPEKKIWQSLPEMEAEKMLDTPAVGFNGKLFVGGGARKFDENNADEKYNKPNDSDHIETLDLRTKQWTLNEVEDEDPYIKNMFVVHRKYLLLKDL